MKRMRLAKVSILFLGLAILAITAPPIVAIGPWNGADASGNARFVPMIHEDVGYIHVFNIPPARVTPEWTEDTSLSDMDFGLAIMNPATTGAIQRRADAIIPIGPGTNLIMRPGHPYILHTQACHHWVGGVEHEYHLPEPSATSPADCASHAGTDPWMWHPDILLMSVNVH